ncbi:DUF4300 family protein [Romboutsia sp. 1001713B170131_170501_G6]|uniref:DUF4300 family protein n=1 Tax=Romboutsia sp. 1001713B170131_170501_G6 TaxID=2787108 RepID=UPI0018AC13FF|nr:DUF4300 family protein [Romboutsia sp. 1001713B170131_170501_G6]
MIKRIIPVILSATLLMTGCTNTKSETSDTIESTKLTYSNLIDEKTQNEIRDILIENKIDKKQADYFIKLVQNYNDKSDINKLKTSKQDFTTIKTQQVPYDELYLDEKWDFNKLNYMDFNCRLTAFSIFKNFIKSEDKFIGDSTSLMFDKDAINDNPMSKFSKEDIDKFTNLYAAVKVKNTQDINKHAETIKKEWEKRKISFVGNKNISMINVFLHSPEDSEVFVGHAGILLQTKDGLLFIEKYAPSLPFQVSKFKNKLELKKYLMDRLDNDTSGNGSSKPIIMENNELIK